MPQTIKRKSKITKDSSLTPPPANLQDIQKWFAGIITQPLINNKDAQPITPDGNSLVAEAEQFLLPSAALTPKERIELYNQQYWWRLLKILHIHFPFLTRLFGHWEFNEAIGVPFLQAYPPDSWSLLFLGKKLPYWVKRNYHASDRKLVLTAAEIDWAYHSSFVAKEMPPLVLHNASPDELSELTLKPIKLQPHIKLFKFNGHYLGFRDAFLEKETEYWLHNEFPPLEKDRTYTFMIFRNPHIQIEWRQITAAQHALLKRFQKGSSLVSACNYLEMAGGPIFEEAFANIQSWFCEWTANGWLSIE